MKSTKTLIIRVDDRLIHGQVLVGWATHFPLRKLVVANDAIAKNEWETNMLLVNATRKLDIEVMSISQAFDQIGEYPSYTPTKKSKPTQMFLFNTIDDLQLLKNAATPPVSINLGGLHFQDDRVEVLPYLYLSAREKALLVELQQNGFSFYCQDIPQKDAFTLDSLLEKKS